MTRQTGRLVYNNIFLIEQLLMTAWRRISIHLIFTLEVMVDQGWNRVRVDRFSRHQRLFTPLKRPAWIASSKNSWKALHIIRSLPAQRGGEQTNNGRVFLQASKYVSATVIVRQLPVVRLSETGGPFVYCPFEASSFIDSMLIGH